MCDFIYKFTRKEYAEKMIGYGQIRIGTLYDYWKESHCEGVRDTEEAKVLRYRIIEYRDGDPLPPQWGMEFFSINPLPGCVISNSIAGKAWENTIPDMYIYCGSSEFKQSAFEEFDAQYDACVKVGPIGALLTAIRDKLGGKERITNAFSGMCAYGERELTYNRGLINTHPALLKKTRYCHQSEYRLAFESRLRGIRPKIITLNGNKHLFTMHATK